MQNQALLYKKTTHTAKAPGGTNHQGLRRVGGGVLGCQSFDIFLSKTPFKQTGRLSLKYGSE
jgi:hypothetical protein